EDRPPVERGEALPVELEGHRQHRAGRLPVDLPARLPVVGDGGDPGVLEDGGVELRGLLGSTIEPETRRDPLGRLHEHPPDSARRGGRSDPASRMVVGPRARSTDRKRNGSTAPPEDISSLTPAATPPPGLGYHRPRSPGPRRRSACERRTSAWLVPASSCR